MNPYFSSLFIFISLLSAPLYAGICDISGSGIGGTGAPALKNNGSGIGGTGSPVPKKNGSGVGGTGVIANESGVGGTGQKTDNQASVIIGTITGFGSICVNGVEIHYAASTPIQINGEPSNVDQLALGQVVSVNVSGTGDEVFAQDIQVMNIVTGPVTEIDPQMNKITVLGQKIHLTGKTYFSDTKQEISNIQKGSFIQVSGLRQADGGIIASRITDNYSTNKAQITGVATNVTAKGFIVQGVIVTTLNKLTIKEGQHVSVRGLMAAETIIAKQIMIPKMLEGQKFKIEGLVNIDTKEQLIKIGSVTLQSTDEIKNILLSLPKNKTVIIDGSVKAGQELKVEHLFIKDSINTNQLPIIDQQRQKNNINSKASLNSLDSDDNNDQKKENNSEQLETPLETPEIETSEIEAPEDDTPEIETPEVEVPDDDTPEIEAPEVEAPEVETPEVEVPEVETPEIETPEVEVPEVETPEIETPEVEVPEVETPEIETPEVEVPEVETPEIETPEVEVPEVETPEIETPEIEVPEVETPEIETPEIEVPEVETPEIED